MVFLTFQFHLLLFFLSTLQNYWSTELPAIFGVLYVSPYICCCFSLPRKLSPQSFPSRLASPLHLNLETISFGAFLTLQSWVSFTFHELP